MNSFTGVEIIRPGLQAAVVQWILVTDLPVQQRMAGCKLLLKVTEMLAAAAGDLQHETPLRQQRLQHLGNHFTIASRGWEMQTPVIHGRLLSLTSRGSQKSLPRHWRT